MISIIEDWTKFISKYQSNVKIIYKKTISLNGRRSKILILFDQKVFFIFTSIFVEEQLIIPIYGSNFIDYNQFETVEKAMNSVDFAIDKINKLKAFL